MERNSRKLKKLLEADGWYEVNTNGSHVQFKHPTKDLPKGTVKSIYVQAGWL